MRNCIDNKWRSTGGEPVGAVESRMCVYARGNTHTFFSVYYLSEDLSETLREAYLQTLEAIRVKKKWGPAKMSSLC